MSFESLPNEIIGQIILLCEPTAVFQLSHISRRFYTLVDNHLWRLLCLREFQYWGAEHSIYKRTHDPIDSTNWRNLFGLRWKKQLETTRLLNSILQSQSGRIEKFQKIVDLEYDAKDCLMKHLSADDTEDDYLARRYYSEAVLGCLHRSMAIQEWSEIHATGGRSLERALGAFDMFVLHQRKGDFVETSIQLDSIAKAILDSEPELESKTTRQKALLVASYLTRNRLVGIRGRPEQNYHDLQNNFIGYALHDREHASLPLQSSAIYCGVARRLGLRASPCALPFHVFVTVEPPEGFDLDGRPEVQEKGHPNMYLDPFETDQEVNVSVLSGRLYSVGASSDQHDSYLEPTSLPELVLRTSRNILTSVQDSHRNMNWSREVTTSTRPGVTDLEGAFYGALWAALFFGMPSDGDGPVIATINRRAFLPPFVEHFETHFPMDVALIEEHIIPTFQDSPESYQLKESVRVMRSVDVMLKEVKTRTKEISERVRYEVGQVFKHRRYNYTAVITGWDIECDADEVWMEQMRVNELKRGKHQSFYHVLVEDKSVRYVAEENIEIITPDVPLSLMPLAGKYFKRWDEATKRFVSNIMDEYPDN